MMDCRLEEQMEADIAREHEELRLRVIALEEFLYNLDQRGGLGLDVHREIKALLGQRGADITAEQAREAYMRSSKL